MHFIAIYHIIGAGSYLIPLGTSATSGTSADGLGGSTLTSFVVDSYLELSPLVSKRGMTQMTEDNQQENIDGLGSRTASDGSSRCSKETVVHNPVDRGMDDDDPMLV